MNLEDTIKDLFSRFGQLPGITIECQKELVAIGVRNKAAKAEVFLQGAQVSKYQWYNEAPVLWLSSENEYKGGLPLRGGIPICWPWFGNLYWNLEKIRKQYDTDGLETAPAHGFIRNRQWKVNDILIPADDLTVIEFQYDIAEAEEVLWPFATRLIYTVEIGKQLKASLYVKNLDARPFVFSSALHSYFTVDNISNTRVVGFQKSQYIDALNEWKIETQDGDIEFKSEVDRIYQSAPSPIVLKDEKRELRIVTQGSNSTVVWNPWIEKAKQLSQFNDEDYKTMVCIETANAVNDAISLEPGQSHVLAVDVARNESSW
jgi:glucose-6-phosphate 1-epimerase